MPQEQTTQVTPQEFAAKIKTKYPAYASVPDDQLVEKITAKYPQYKSQIKQAAPAAPPDPLRGASQATTLRAQPQGQAGLNEFLDSPRGQEMRKSNVDAGQFGAEMLLGGEALKAGRALFKPTTSMVSETSKLLDAEGKPIVRMIEKEGASAAQKAGQAVVKGIKSVPAWMKANPYKALAVEAVAREMGVDPVQLAHKMLKYGSGLLGEGTTHVPGR